MKITKTGHRKRLLSEAAKLSKPVFTYEVKLCIDLNAFLAPRILLKALLYGAVFHAAVLRR